MRLFRRAERGGEDRSRKPRLHPGPRYLFLEMKMRPEAPTPFPNMRRSTRPGAAQTSRPLHEGQAQLCIRAKIDDRWKMVSAMAPDRTVLPQGADG